MAKKVLIVTDRLGRGDEELGARLIESFLHYLSQADEVPSTIMLMNGGVRLACADSPVLGLLEKLVERGVIIRSCVSCLQHFDLVDSLATGEVGTMPGTVELLMADEDVLTLA